MNNNLIDWAVENDKKIQNLINELYEMSGKTASKEEFIRQIVEEYKENNEY